MANLTGYDDIVCECAVRTFNLLDRVFKSVIETRAYDIANDENAIRSLFI